MSYPKKKSISLEPIIGIGTSESVQKGNDNQGWRIGCGLVYMFNEHFGISSGLQVNQYSTDVVSGTDAEYFNYGNSYSFWNYCWVNANYNFTYAELPVIIRYKSSHAEKFGVLVEAGFIVGYLVSCSESGYIYNLSTTSIITIPTPPNGKDSSSFNSVTPKAASFNLQMHMAFGLFIPISKRCSMIIDVSIDKGYTNTGNSSNDFVKTVFVSPFYYYNKNSNFSSPTIFNYGTNSSGLINIRLNIKLGTH